MAIDNILQSDFAVKFVYPFFLIFFVLFAILEKTKIFGDDRKQINALVSLIISFIFVAAFSPKMIVGDLILFLSIAMIIMFVILILWGFVSGSELKSGIFGQNKWLPWVVGVVIILGVIVVVFISAGVNLEGIFKVIFQSSWSKNFWSNVLFFALIVIALAVALKTSGGGKG